MKRSLTILMVVAVVVLLALPRPAAAGVKFGLKGGANVANVNGDIGTALENWKSRVGFCAGVFLELNFGRILTIQPEALYTVKGADTGTGKLTFDYIEFPILLKVRIPTGSIHPFVFAGPAFGFRLDALVDGVKINDMPPADYSAVLGGGLQLGRSIHIDVRYTMGLQKLEIPDIDTIDLKNSVLSATLGLAF
ncbi:MAG TPA: porin family protein [Acidobacteriota bacterium]|nr:porin family protein [Acidobacteriota bacterium]